MREYLFRAKAIEPFVDGDQWGYGFGVHVIELADGGKEYVLYTENGTYEVDPETVGQYTGLKDRNDKEIYDGDLFTDTADHYLWQVFYSDGCYYAASGPDTLMLQEFLSNSGSCDVEVVGNRFDNPGLLGEVRE